MCRLASIRVPLFTVAIALVALVALGSSAAVAAPPTVQISYPEQEHWYCSGISSAAGTASADARVGVDRVYCQLYYYSAGNYDYVYWDWQTRTWHTGPTWDTMVLATGTNSWQVVSGFPTDWQPERTYALYARVYDTNGDEGANVHYFYIGDRSAPAVNLAILRPTLWPANGKMVLAAEVSVQDDCDPTPEVVICVTSSDPQKPPKNGKVKPDWEIVQDGDVWQVWLRAENAGKRAVRVYTVSAVATDASGNSGLATGTVTVP